MQLPWKSSSRFGGLQLSAYPVGELGSSSGYYGEKNQGIGGPERNRILGVK